jgi:hypothetical protein
MIYRITLQYRFNSTTLRNTSTDKLNQRILFSSVMWKYPRLLALVLCMETKIPEKNGAEVHIYKIKEKTNYKINEKKAL